MRRVFENKKNSLCRVELADIYDHFKIKFENRNDTNKIDTMKQESSKEYWHFALKFRSFGKQNIAEYIIN